MQTWGLTGGIASGKSTVARHFVACGVPVVDADALYHALVAPVGRTPSALAQRIEASFAHSLNADGTLNRQALGAQIFADAKARARLDAIAHPAVSAAAQARLAELAQQGHSHALYDVPLLYELGLQKNFAGVVLVWVPAEVQLQRLMQRDNSDEAAARARIAAQMPLQDKRALCQKCIDNSGPPQSILPQVRSIVAQWGS